VDNPYTPPEAELQDLVVEEKVSGFLEHEPASSGHRFLAYFIDGMIALPVSIGVLVALLLLGTLVMGEAWLDAVPEQLIGFLAAVPSAIVFGLIEGSGWQASPGKKLLGLRVVQIDGRDLDPGTALQRNFAKYMGMTLCGLFAFSVLGGSGKSIWDNFAKTRVVKRNP
jgi:uncharacterized RDD family membrane protein YckC